MKGYEVVLDVKTMFILHSGFNIWIHLSSISEHAAPKLKRCRSDKTRMYYKKDKQ